MCSFSVFSNCHKQFDAYIINSVDKPGRNCEEILESWRCIMREEKTTIAVPDTLWAGHSGTGVP